MQRRIVDGGLVNPIPVSVCRALGADILIAVNLNSDLVGRRFEAAPEPRDVVNAAAVPRDVINRLLEKVPQAWRDHAFITHRTSINYRPPSAKPATGMSFIVLN